MAGLAGVAFGWGPDAFWAATPAELAALVRAVGGDAPDPCTHATIATLKERFPDG
ncbi:MAG: phage tail assembly chaperone [Sphingomonas hengshuiensis]|uniref:Phage tail assembly chaperone n=2 Tax=Sphingomonas TaxID=13687 RepID=A0A2W4YWU9_9SPHN|nr:MAG: phage tail assembly chaperone [Sphingomonas hengshuiensis]